MTRRRVLNDQQAADVARRYVAGETIDELAATFGVSNQPVRRALQEAGVAFRRRSHRTQEVDVVDLKRRYRAGATQDQFAAHFRVSRITIRRRLIAANVELRPRSEAISAAKRRPRQ